MSTHAPDEVPVATRREPGRYEALSRLAAGLAKATTPEEACTAIAELAAPAIGAAFSSAGLCDDDAVSIRVAATLEPAVASRWSEVPLDEAAPITDAVRLGTPVTIAGRDEIRTRYPSIADDDAGVERISAYPLSDPSGAVRAGIGFSWTNPAGFDDRHVGAVVALSEAALRRVWTTERAEMLAGIMEALIREAPIGFAFLDLDLRFQLINERLAERNGRSVADHLGRTVREVVPSLADGIEGPLREVIATGRPSGMLELTGETPADPGITHAWERMYFPVVDRAGEMIGVAAIVSDVTERHRAVQELRRLYARERATANRLQLGLMPRQLAQPAGYDITARYLAEATGTRIGGDWYDLIEIRPDRFGVVIGDVVGHGLDSAITMTRLRHALAGLCHAIDAPGPLLDRLDEYVTQEGPEGDAFVATLFYGLLDPASGRIDFSLAGHLPPIVLRPGEPPKLTEGGRSRPLGITGEPRPAGTIDLLPGDALILYTDGVIERRGETVDRGIRRLMDAMYESITDIGAFADRVLSEVAGDRHDDDLALMVIRRLPE
jgi:PAS domain S-box-containing protein